MLKNISIRNFKSIKELDFKAKRVNVFIGEPNTGKSNILEALGMFSLCYSRGTDRTPIRYREVANLFYDNEMHHKSEFFVKADDYSYKFESPDRLEVTTLEEGKDRTLFEFNFRTEQSTQPLTDAPVKFYQFKVLDSYKGYGSYVYPPYGDNLFNILMNHKLLKEMVSSLLKEKGYRLYLRTRDREIEVIKEIEDVVYSYPYQSLSDTLQRIIFYWAIIETNRNSTILLEEPESHMSPFYIRDIADRIAHDTNNQYFLVTHNPYFLTTVAEKTKPKDLAIFVTYLEDYQTKLRKLTSDDIVELLDLDTAVFFNLDKLVAGEGVH